MPWRFAAVAGVLDLLARGLPSPTIPTSILIALLVFVCFVQAIVISLKWKISVNNAKSGNNQEADPANEQKHIFVVSDRDKNNPGYDYQSNDANNAIARYTKQLRTATVLLVIVTAFSVAILYVTDKTLKTDQRPWVGNGHIGYPPSEAFSVQFIDGGKSPALDVTIKAFLWLPAFEKMPPEIPNARCTRECKVIGVEMLPNIPFEFVLGRTGDQDGWIVARADYRDAGGDAHKTVICMFHAIATHDLRDCPIPNSNYAD